MTIVITDAKDPIELTQSEHDRLLFEYNQAFRMYFGQPPSFESWLRNRKNAEKPLHDSYSLDKLK